MHNNMLFRTSFHPRLIHLPLPNVSCNFTHPLSLLPCILRLSVKSWLSSPAVSFFPKQDTFRRPRKRFVMVSCYLVPCVLHVDLPYGKESIYPVLLSDPPCTAIVNIKSEPLLYDAVSTLHKNCINNQLDTIQSILAHPSLLCFLLEYLLGRCQGGLAALGFLQGRGKVCHCLGPVLQHELVAHGPAPITRLQCCWKPTLERRERYQD